MSVYAKKQKTSKWLCVCLDRNQLPQRSIDTSRSISLLTGSHAVPLPLNSSICYIHQFNVTARKQQQRKDALVTIHPLPFINALSETSALSVSFLPDAVGDERDCDEQMLQGLLCSNRGILTRRSLSPVIARSIPAVFSTLCGLRNGVTYRGGKKELVYSPVLKVNRVANVQFEMSAVPTYAFKDIQPWVIH